MQPRSIALLALLASSQVGLTREKVIGYLWPESDSAQARHLLTNALYHIRRVLGAAAVVGAGESLRLNRDVVTADTIEFGEALARGDLAQTHALYGGPFLDGLFISDAAAFERWVDAERNRFARLYAQALERAARQQGAAGDATAAAEWWSRLVGAEPYNSRAALEFARALREGGDSAAAVTALQEHVELLRIDLGVEPNPEVSRLLAELQPSKPVTGPPRERRKRTTGPGSGRERTWPRRSHASLDSITRPIGRYSRTARIAGAAAGVALAAVVLMFGSRTLRQRPPPVTNQASPLLLIGDFTTDEQDSSISTIVTEALRADLEASPAVRSYPVGAMRDALQRMELPPVTAVSGRIAQEMAVREGMPLVLLGEVRRIGEGYALTARVLASADNSTIATFRETASSPHRLIAAIDRLSKSLRGSLGESARQIRSSRPLDDVTTGSLEALRHYSLGRRALREGNKAAARLLFEQAVAEDSTFAMAYHYLSMNRATAFDDADAGEARARAFRHRDKLPAYERYSIEGGYWWQEGEPERAAAAWEAALEIRPDDVAMLNNLAFYYGPRHPEKFAEMAARAFAGDPGAPASVVNYAVALFRQRQFDSAQRVLYVISPRPPGMTVLEACMLMARGDYATAEQVLLHAWRDAEGKEGRHMNVAWTIAGLTAITGRLNESLAWMEEVRKSPALSRADSLRVETVMARLVVFLAGDTSAARARLAHAATRFPPRDIPLQSRPLLDFAHTYVATAQFDRARLALREFEDSLPRSLRWRQRGYSGHVAGMLALADGDRPRAAREFRASGREGCRWCEDFGMAALYQSMNVPDSAIARYERYLSAAEPVRWGDDSWWLATSLERLAQLHQRQGNREQAALYYERFAELWKRADARLQPRVRAARSAAARLRSEQAVAQSRTP